MAGLWPYSGSQVMLGNKRADQTAKQRADSTQPEVPLALRRAKSIISTYIDKYTAMTQKTEFWKAMGNWPLWARSRGTWREPRLLPAFA
ncbi:hypothetical protein TNCV_2110231 [Trichonephila clavipes]|nr:hypothetical protein TNCV_2110231 [Trichonephila clavipes]